MGHRSRADNSDQSYLEGLPAGIPAPKSFQSRFCGIEADLALVEIQVAMALTIAGQPETAPMIAEQERNSSNKQHGGVLIPGDVSP